MSDLGPLLGGNHEFILNDKTYKVSLVTQDIKLQYERHLFARAKELARNMKDMLSSEEYAEHLVKLNENYLSGKYDMLSPMGIESLRSVSGILYFCSLLFGVDETEMIKIVGQSGERQQELISLIDVVLKESFPHE